MRRINIPYWLLILALIALPILAKVFDVQWSYIFTYAFPPGAALLSAYLLTMADNAHEPNKDFHPIFWYGFAVVLGLIFYLVWAPLTTRPDYLLFGFLYAAVMLLIKSFGLFKTKHQLDHEDLDRKEGEL